MKSLTNRLRARAQAAASAASAGLMLVAAPFVLAMALAKEGPEPTPNPFLEAIREARATANATLQALVATVGGEKRAKMTDEESATFTALTAEIREHDLRRTELLEIENREQAAADLAGGIDRASGRVGPLDGIRSEPMTYGPANRGQSYFRDLGLAHVGHDPEAAQRLAHHRDEMNVEMPKREARIEAAAHKAAEEFRSPNGSPGLEFRVNPNRTDGQGGEFVPPLWLLDEYAGLARAGRITADRCRKIPLPAGTDSINIPRIATGTATAAQTADGAGVQSTDMTTATVTAGVKTIAGQQDVALQLIEQSPIMFDEIVFADLAADEAAKLDLQVINGSNAAGQMQGALGLSGIHAVSYTDATPTVGELYPKGADAVQQVCNTRFLPPQAWIMNPRRWFWMTAALDSTGRPLVSPIAQNPYSALANATDLLAEGPVGFWHGLPVWIDPNVPMTLGAGTEDAVIAARFSDWLLFEGSLRTRALPEILSGTLQVRLQLYCYAAFTAGRYPAATSVISGSGLIAPTF